MAYLHFGNTPFVRFIRYHVIPKRAHLFPPLTNQQNSTKIFLKPSH